MSARSRTLWRVQPPVILLLLLASAGTRAQTVTNSLIPVVTVQATDPYASWSGDSGTFTVFREGRTNDALMVYYLTGGTASNGVDYAALAHWVTIPAGVRSNTIAVDPIDTGKADIETVELKLVPSPLSPPINYVIGDPAGATVFITPPNVTNLPPIATLTSPLDGSSFTTPGVVPLVALGADRDGQVVSMEFFADTNSLGVVTNWVVVDPPGPGHGFLPGTRAFFLTWSNPPLGKFALTAKATDNGGASGISSPVHIAIESGPPPTNVPPVVRLTSPPNGALFHSPVNIPIYAYAHDPDGSIANVEFFAGTNDLGAGHGLCLEAHPGWTGPGPCPTNFFVLVWSNAPPGTYLLSAVAADDAGASSVSQPVKIAVVPAPPPPTNRPPIVSMVATDPLAIEGTNCWPWRGLAAVQPAWGDWTAPIATWRFFTNCGPKNATFTVRRLGDTNEDLTVLYSIGGTATNGVDYVPLPDSVVIPAGERSSQITVVPLDDGPPDINSTVVLKLLQSTNYVVGFPHRAAALILDDGAPHPRVEMLPGNTFHLSATGPDGAWFHVEYSTDLANWTPICTNQVVNGLIEFVDPDASPGHPGFYRTVPEAGPPVN
ncbi:MAG TPA: Ig-like domain-containing protein [Verrucomicrobiae bacterium]|nr:Ig-like domain-containing protein [Verrucomicrobiae bacterium]